MPDRRRPPLLRPHVADVSAATRCGPAEKQGGKLRRGARHVVLIPQITPRSRLSLTRAIARLAACLSVRLPSFSAQALATAEFGALLPGMVAQPPFSMRARRSQDEETLLNATSFAAESVCCWNFSTQIGASAATTAVSARWLAILRGAAECPSKRRKPDNR